MAQHPNSCVSAISSLACQKFTFLKQYTIISGNAMSGHFFGQVVVPKEASP